MLTLLHLYCFLRGERERERERGERGERHREKESNGQEKSNVKMTKNNNFCNVTSISASFFIC